MKWDESEEQKEVTYVMQNYQINFGGFEYRNIP